jgi:hypothetical protein
MRKIILLKIILSLGLIPYFTIAQTKFNTQKTGHEFYIDTPNYMVKTTDLNDAANFQYTNKIKEAYTIVISDSKEAITAGGSKYENLEEFHDELIKSLKTGLEDPSESEPKIFEQNGLKFYQIKLNGSFLNTEKEKKFPVIYLITYVESDKYYYQILSWSIASNFDSLLPDYLKIASSIREGKCE